MHIWCLCADGWSWRATASLNMTLQIFCSVAFSNVQAHTLEPISNPLLSRVKTLTHIFSLFTPHRLLCHNIVLPPQNGEDFSNVRMATHILYSISGMTVRNSLYHV
jgi:hypothetical protein